MIFRLFATFLGTVADFLCMIFVTCVITTVFDLIGPTDVLGVMVCSLLGQCTYHNWKRSHGQFN